MKRPLLAVAVAALLPAAAEAQVTQLVFEELLDGEFIADYYDGGFGSAGTGPGPADGVAFASNARVQRTGNYQGNPTPPGIMTWATGTSTFMNVSGGFSGGFSLFYAAPGVPGLDGGSATIWSGLNATGTILATLDLPAFPSGVGTPACPGPEPYCPWVAAGATFSGTAMSVSLSGEARTIGIDNVTLGSDDPATRSTVVPEPTTLVLTGSSLLLLAGTRAVRRRRAATSA